ncbi:MAG TPA: S-layer homology domain-containing protein [Firmicutes bacterium]|nr:S-layer homology domain-containing protein [Bacillota bacterium]
MYRRLRKYTVLTVLLVLLAGAVVGSQVGRADGLDAGGGHWAQENVRFIQKMGLCSPAPAGAENYDASVTPTEWNAMVCRLFGAVPGDDNVTGSLRYWLWCYTGAFGTQEGIARGHAFGAFMKILNMYGREKLSSLGLLRQATKFADWAEVPDLQGALVDVAVARGLIAGFPDGTLRPQQYLTLGEAATFLRRAVEEFHLAEQIPLPSLPVNLAEKSTGDLRLVLYTDRSWYRQEETVGVVAAVENRSSSELAFTRWNIGDPAIYIRVEPVDPGFPVPRLTLEEEGLSPIRLPAVSTGTLAAGATIVQRIAWKTFLPGTPPGDTPDKPPEPLPPGKYRITASFYLQPPSANGPEISTSVEIEIAGEGAILVNADQARDLALKDPEVAQWWDAHAGRNLVKQENGQWYVQTAEGWQKATGEYAATVANLLPEVQVTFARGLWEVVILCKMGNPPHRLVVHVHPGTGEIVDRQAHER